MTTSRRSVSALLLVLIDMALWAQRFLLDVPFPYRLAVFAVSVATVALVWSVATERPVGTGPSSSWPAGLGLWCTGDSG